MLNSGARWLDSPSETAEGKRWQGAAPLLNAGKDLKSASSISLAKLKMRSLVAIEEGGGSLRALVLSMWRRLLQVELTLGQVPGV